MTREEALRRVKGYLTDIIPAEDFSEVEEIIQALEPEPCEDCISRKAVLDHIYGINGLEGLELSNVFEKHYADFIKSLPPVTPQQKTGRWIKQTLSVKPFGDDTVLCDQCAFLTDKDNCYEYCPNCGAKMEEVEK